VEVVVLPHWGVVGVAEEERGQQVLGWGPQEQQELGARGEAGAREGVRVLQRGTRHIGPVAAAEAVAVVEFAVAVAVAAAVHIEAVAEQQQLQPRYTGAVDWRVQGSLHYTGVAAGEQGRTAAEGAPSCFCGGWAGPAVVTEVPPEPVPGPPGSCLGSCGAAAEPAQPHCPLSLHTSSPRDAACRTGHSPSSAGTARTHFLHPRVFPDFRNKFHRYHCCW